MKSFNIDKLLRGKRINFLIGAGASADIYNTLSLGNNLPSFENLVADENITEDNKKILYVYYFLRWIKPMIQKTFDANDSDTKSINYQNYKNLVKWFYDFLQNEGNEQPKRINIFTTNYDLLFEWVFDEFLSQNSLIYFNDGSRGFFEKYISNTNFYLNVTHSGYNDNYRREVPTVNLFKLHGSISWELSEDKNKIKINNSMKTIENINSIVEGNLKLSIEEDIEKILDEIAGIKENQIVYLNQKLTELCSNLNLDGLQKFWKQYKTLPIINPDKYKFLETVSEQHYYQLIRSFSYELEQKQSVLIVFGFSFADEHIKDIFKRSLLNPELQVIIISYSSEGQKKLKDELEGYKNIIFLPNYEQGEKNKDNSELKGNFAYFLNLLKGNNNDN